jgi:hypothetical protein
MEMETLLTPAMALRAGSMASCLHNARTRLQVFCVVAAGQAKPDPGTAAPDAWAGLLAGRVCCLRLDCSMLSYIEMARLTLLLSSAVRMREEQSCARGLSTM